MTLTLKKRKIKKNKKTKKQSGGSFRKPYVQQSAQKKHGWGPFRWGKKTTPPSPVQQGTLQRRLSVSSPGQSLKRQGTLPVVQKAQSPQDVLREAISLSKTNRTIHELLTPAAILAEQIKENVRPDMRSSISYLQKYREPEMSRTEIRNLLTKQTKYPLPQGVSIENKITNLQAINWSKELLNEYYGIKD
jgi:hypothetical protein